MHGWQRLRGTRRGALGRGARRRDREGTRDIETGYAGLCPLQERMNEMKNTLGDVHNLLMEQMERLAVADDGDELAQAIKRADAMTSVAQQVTANAANIIKAAHMKARLGDAGKMPAMLGDGAGE